MNSTARRDLNVGHLQRRGGRLPLYRQLETTIRALAAELPAGALIPSERELAADTGLSRTTIRRTLDNLVGEGVLGRSHGYATYVARPKIQQTVALHGFTSDIVHSGRRPGARLLVQRREPASLSVASDLGVFEGTDVIHVERLRFVDDVPFVLLRSYYRSDLTALLRLRDTDSAWGTLGAKHGIVVSRIRQELDLSAMSAPDARLLGEEPGNLAFRLQMVASDQHGHPFERTDAIYRASLTRFHMELQDESASRTQEGGSSNSSVI